VKKKRGRMGEVSDEVGVKLFEKAGSYLSKIRRMILGDIQGRVVFNIENIPVAGILFAYTYVY
jgi:hypothetical protein